MSLSEFQYIFSLPADFEDYCWEEKGCFLNGELECAGKSYLVNFYDPARLNQEIADALAHDGLFVEENLVVVERVTKQNLETAVSNLVARSELNNFTQKEQNRESQT